MHQMRASVNKVDGLFLANEMLEICKGHPQRNLENRAQNLVNNRVQTVVEMLNTHPLSVFQ